MRKIYFAAMAAAAVVSMSSCEKNPNGNNTTDPEEPEVLNRQTDSLALVDIYNASKGAEWAKNNWDLTTPIDTWYGVRVNKDNRVDSLKLATKTVTSAEWELPETIGKLTELVNLSLGNNLVKGDFPEGIYSLVKLTTLDLSSNKITGSFSEKLGNLAEIEYITMLGNKEFGGEIPAEIGNLKKLFRLNLSNTGISGSIPEEVKGCESMQEFMVFGAKLSGQLPDIWDSFKKDFKILMLHGNADLTGPLPASLGKVTTNASPFSIQLYNCAFTGNIPESYSTLPATCKQLRLQGNQLSGEVPASVKAHANWAVWDADKYIFPQQDGFGLK